MFRSVPDRCPGWGVVYDGYGRVTCESGTIHLVPAPATHDDETHSALLVENGAIGTANSDPRAIGAKVTTNKQLRQGDANSWEVGWFVWGYEDPQHFYALLLKPNGWEITKRDPQYEGGQRFLATGEDPSFKIGTTHTIVITGNGKDGDFTVRVDGKKITRISDTERPYSLGVVALYAEDADVTFSDIWATYSTSETAPER
ncbi:hypothetical protein DDD63_04605 [Actinobaculum sp. 313]|nr:hypothetical protein DDD63_04605 [Actinobaculum sp. 313]